MQDSFEIAFTFAVCAPLAAYFHRSPSLATDRDGIAALATRIAADALRPRSP